MSNTYFYHPDHLGSTSIITNSYGEVTQNISYIPYGEIFVEETAGGWQSPYYFNAKELDEETGLYYYGARYLDPAGARWLSADPMLENNPDKTPYHYCSGNPVKLMDPTGMFETEMEAIDYAEKNNLNYRIFQMEDGGFEVFDETSLTSYAYNGILCDNLEVSAPSRTEEEYLDAAKRLYWQSQYDKTGNFEHWVKSKGAYDFDENFSEMVGPLYRGTALLIPIVGVVNDVNVLGHGADIYGNDADELDTGVAIADLLTFGFANGLKLGAIVNKCRKVQSSTSYSTKVKLAKYKRNAELTNKITTYGGASMTTVKDYYSK